MIDDDRQLSGLDLVDFTRRFQAFDPGSGGFLAAPLSNDAYAARLGIDPSYLSHIYAGRKSIGLAVVRGLARLVRRHPVYWHEFMAVVAAETATASQEAA